LILADEPCASLDPRSARLVFGELLRICREEGTTLLVVAHDEALLGEADQVLEMQAINRIAAP
jgi:ABC-type lipoprotein export system ATPase subunit